MLKHLQKFLKPAKAEPQEENPEMTTQVEQPQAVDNTAAELAAHLATATEALAAVQSQLAELSVKYEASQAALSVIEEAKLALIAEAKAKHMAVRKERVEAAIGTAKAPAMLAATEMLGDEQFEAVVGALAGSLEVEAKSTLFTEVGVSAASDAPPVVIEESQEAKLLKQKYSKNVK